MPQTGTDEFIQKQDLAQMKLHASSITRRLLYEDSVPPPQMCMVLITLKLSLSYPGDVDDGNDLERQHHIVRNAILLPERIEKYAVRKY